MTDFTSEIKTIPHDGSKVFAVLSDLSNLERIQDRVPHDKVKDFTCDRDTCSMTVEPVGLITFRIIEREPDKTIKFEATGAPVPIYLWIQLKQTADNETKMKMTVRAELSVFIKPMVSKPLQDAVEKLSEVIARFPYE